MIGKLGCFPSSDVLSTSLSRVCPFELTLCLFYCLLFLSFLNLGLRLLRRGCRHTFLLSNVVLCGPIDLFWSLWTKM
jgi:hypothetical protein